LENYLIKFIGDRDNEFDVPNDISSLFKMIDFQTRAQVIGRDMYTVTEQDINALFPDK